MGRFKKVTNGQIGIQWHILREKYQEPEGTKEEPITRPRRLQLPKIQ